MRELNPRQISFCHEYLKDFNATQAAIRSGYSEKSARAIASELLPKPNIKQEIDIISSSVFQAKGLSVERIVGEITMIAFSGESSNIEKLKALAMLLEHKNGNESKQETSLQSKAEHILSCIRAQSK